MDAYDCFNPRKGCKVHLNDDLLDWLLRLVSVECVVLLLPAWDVYSPRSEKTNLMPGVSGVRPEVISFLQPWLSGLLLRQELCCVKCEELKGSFIILAPRLLKVDHRQCYCFNDNNSNVLVSRE